MKKLSDKNKGNFTQVQNAVQNLSEEAATLSKRKIMATF
jgi:hypothetical protein